MYEDIRQKLISKGIPETEIAFIHTADTEAKKKELFAKVRSGQVRVLLGSTSKMGAGTNVQDRLIALHDLDGGPAIWSSERDGLSGRAIGIRRCIFIDMLPKGHLIPTSGRRSRISRNSFRRS